MPNERGVGFFVIFEQYVAIYQKRCISDMKLMCGCNRKPYWSNRMVSILVPFSDTVIVTTFPIHGYKCNNLRTHSLKRVPIKSTWNWHNIRNYLVSKLFTTRHCNGTRQTVDGCRIHNKLLTECYCSWRHNAHR